MCHIISLVLDSFAIMSENQPAGADKNNLLILLTRQNNLPNLRRELFDGLDKYAKAMKKNALPVAEFKVLLKGVHDVLVRSEVAVKSEVMRIIRYGFTTAAHGEEILAEVSQPHPQTCFCCCSAEILPTVL